MGEFRGSKTYFSRSSVVGETGTMTCRITGEMQGVPLRDVCAVCRDTETTLALSLAPTPTPIPTPTPTLPPTPTPTLTPTLPSSPKQVWREINLFDQWIPAVQTARVLRWFGPAEFLLWCDTMSRPGLIWTARAARYGRPEPPKRMIGRWAEAGRSLGQPEACSGAASK